MAVPAREDAEKSKKRKEEPFLNISLTCYPPTASGGPVKKEGKIMEEIMKTETMLPVEEKLNAEKMLKLLATMTENEMKSYAVFLSGVDFAKKLYGIKTA